MAEKLTQDTLIVGSFRVAILYHFPEWRDYEVARIRRMIKRDGYEALFADDQLIQVTHENNPDNFYFLSSQFDEG